MFYISEIFNLHKFPSFLLFFMVVVVLFPSFQDTH